MANIPVSEVTVIASILGLFFLIVAFYKSVFHKRMPPTQAALQPRPAPDVQAEDEQPIKLSDPFQQVPIDVIPPPAKKNQQDDNAAFYPKIQQASSSQVSAFRQYNPNSHFSDSEPASQNNATYEWE